VAATAAKELARSWDWGTGHLNVQIELTREQHADYFLDTIIEGPHDWPVRPAAEIFYESDVSLTSPIRAFLWS
jgi:hypothetical protein